MVDIRGQLPAAIDVVQPYDVVLAEVASHLHLDQFERDLAGIGKPMNAPDGDIARLVFVDAAHVIADRNLRAGRSSQGFDTMPSRPISHT